MQIERKKLDNSIPFKDIPVGDVIEDEEHFIYLKINNNDICNCFDLVSNDLASFKDDEFVIHHPTAKLVF